jgi:hypothetical protein
MRNFLMPNSGSPHPSVMQQRNLLLDETMRLLTELGFPPREANVTWEVREAMEFCREEYGPAMAAELSRAACS